MALWKTEYGFAPQFTPHALARPLGLAALFAIAAAPGLLLLWAVPLPLVPNVLALKTPLSIPMRATSTEQVSRFWGAG